MIVVLMGAAGAGKSTVGRCLAMSLGWTFVDADDLHSPGNVERMRAGLPLTDADRAPWLDALTRLVAAHAMVGENLVLACSALRERYRERIASGAPSLVRFVHLRADERLLDARVRGRAGHFLPPSLVRHQVAALEEPAPSAHVLVIDADAPVGALVERIRAWLDGEPGRRAEDGAAR